MGFKNGNGTECKNKTGQQLIICIEERAFSADDIFPFERTHFRLEPFYVDDNNLGLVQSVRLETGVISKKIASTLSIKMNSNIAYFITISDSKLQFTSNNLDLVPRTVIILKEHDGVANFVLKEII